MSYMTEERRLIQETAREFAMREVLPLANKLDPEQGEIPMSLRDQLAEMGYFGIVIPEQYGGLGLGVFEYCLITEELARAWMSVASIIARGNGLIGSRAMNEEQKRRYLTRMAKGEFLGAFSMSEPGAGSDIANISCRAKRDGDSWVINGSKYWCTFADGADYIMIVARTSEPPDNRRRHLGLSTFLIEKPRGALPEGCQGNPIPKIGYFGWKTFELGSTIAGWPANAWSARKAARSTPWRRGWRRRAPIPPRARSGLPAAGSRTRSNTRSSACSSASRSPSSRRSDSSSRRWRPRSRPRAS